VTKQTSVQGTRWAFMKPFDIYDKNGSGEVYLHRLRILQTPWFAVYLHDLNLPDTDNDPHDHPWVFTSFIVRGGYTETVFCSEDRTTAAGKYDTCKRTWNRRSIHKMKMDRAHKITSVQPRTRSLIVAGRRKASWGFWTENGFVDWHDYVQEGDTSA
jgi:hypothetical protein